MTRDDPKEKRKGIAPASGGLRPYIVYRNPKGIPIRTSYGQAEKECRAKGLHVVQKGRQTGKLKLLRD